MNPLFIGLLRQDLLLAVRNPGEWLMPLTFFLLVVTIFPLAVSPEPAILRRIAPGVIWAVALLSSLLSQGTLFRQDAEDGTLEQILLSPQPLVLATLAKVVAHWLFYGAPLVILAPLLGAWMHMSLDELFILLITLPLGTGIFSLFATFSAALLAGFHHNHFLGALIALPLCLPAVIFAAAAVTSDTLAPVLLLSALFTLSLTVLPLVSVSTLRCGSGG